MYAGIFFSVTSIKNIEEIIWIVTKAGFSFQNWLNVILIYGIICPIDRLDLVKTTQQHTLLCSSEIGKPAQVLSLICDC